jgi:hypothetical protein
MKKKKTNYNPFKMLGSWIGMIIYPSLIFLPALIQNNETIRTIFLYTIYLPVTIILKLSIPKTGGLENIGLAIMILIITTPIIGFLIGWGIHSYIRRKKTKQKRNNNNQKTKKDK